MGLYLYQHPVTHQVVEIEQKMNDVHEYVDKQGVRYERIFVSSNHAIDTKVDPFSKKDWMRRTAKKGMTVGDMMDESSSLSEKRAQKAGEDPLKKRLFDDYRQKTGKNHPEDRPKKIENKYLEIEL